MAYLDKVRFVAGDEAEEAEVKVYQGYDADALNGSAGFPMVYVTAHTLNLMAEETVAAFAGNAWDLAHNAPTDFWDNLAFGGTVMRGKPDAVFAPDGVTPLYLVGSWTVGIVQRFNPDGGKTYDIVNGDTKVGEGHWGVWVNETPVCGKPVPVGFVVNPDDWAEGRGDTPPFATEGDAYEDLVARFGHEDELSVDECEAVGLDGTGFGSDPRFPFRESTLTPVEAAKLALYRKPSVLFVTIEYSNGTEAKMEFSGYEHQSGTAYDGTVPEGNEVLESAISEAVTTAGLWPPVINQE